MNLALKGASIFDNWRRRMTKSAVRVGRFRWNLPGLLANLVDGSVQDGKPRKKKNESLDFITNWQKIRGESLCRGESLRTDKPKYGILRAMREKKDSVAWLSSKADYTMFSYGEKSIRFAAPYVVIVSDKFKVLESRMDEIEEVIAVRNLIDNIEFLAA